MLFSKFDITRRGASTIGEFKRRGRRGKKYCNYANYICIYIYIYKLNLVRSEPPYFSKIFPVKMNNAKFHGRGLLEGTKLWRFYTQKATFHGDVLLRRPFGIGPKAEFCSIGQSVISSIDTWRFQPPEERLPVPVEYHQRHGGYNG